MLPNPNPDALMYDLFALSPLMPLTYPPSPTTPRKIKEKVIYTSYLTVFHDFSWTNQRFVQEMDCWSEINKIVRSIIWISDYFIKWRHVNWTNKFKWKYRIPNPDLSFLRLIRFMPFFFIGKVWWLAVCFFWFQSQYHEFKFEWLIFSLSLCSFYVTLRLFLRLFPFIWVRFRWRYVLEGKGGRGKKVHQIYQVDRKYDQLI